MRTALEVAWQAVAIVASVAVWRVATRELRSRGIALLPAVMVLGALALLPFEAHDAVKRIRQYHHYTRAQADRAGALQFHLHPKTFDRVAEIVPRDGTIYVKGSGKFRFWAFTSLLPRTAVDVPSKAEWILQAGTAPTTAGSGVTIGRVYQVGPQAYLARVER